MIRAALLALLGAPTLLVLALGVALVVRARTVPARNAEGLLTDEDGGGWFAGALMVALAAAVLLVLLGALDYLPNPLWPWPPVLHLLDGSSSLLYPNPQESP